RFRPRVLRRPSESLSECGQYCSCQISIRYAAHLPAWVRKHSACKGAKAIDYGEMADCIHLQANACVLRKRRRTGWAPLGRNQMIPSSYSSSCWTVSGSLFVCSDSKCITRIRPANASRVGASNTDWSGISIPISDRTREIIEVAINE